MEVTLVEINVKPDMIDAFLKVFLENHIGALKEPGNLRFDVLQDEHIPTRFYIYEAYADQAAVAAHKQTPHYLKCVEALEGIMSEVRKKTNFKGVYP